MHAGWLLDITYEADEALTLASRDAGHLRGASKPHAESNSLLPPA